MGLAAKVISERTLAGLLLLAAAGGWIADGQFPRAAGRWPGGPPGVLFPVLVGGKVGYIDRAGRLVLPAAYDVLCEETEVDAVTMASIRPCFTLTVPWADDFRDGQCLVARGEKRSLIDTAGRVVRVDLKEGELLRRNQALRRLRDGHWRAVRATVTDGTPVRLVPPVKAQSVDIVSARKLLGSAGYRLAQDRSWVIQRCEVGIADANGTALLAPQLIEIQPFRNGLARVGVFEEERLGTVGQWVKKLGFLTDTPVSRTVVKWGYIDRSGRWVWRPKR